MLHGLGRLGMRLAYWPHERMRHFEGCGIMADA